MQPVQQVRLVAGRAELRACGRHLAKLDRTEAVWKVHGNRRHQENRGQWQADERYPGANEDRKSAKELTTIVIHAIECDAGTPSA